MSLFLILFAPITASALAIINGAGSGIGGDAKAITINGTDAGLGLGGDAGDNWLAIVGAEEDVGDKGVRNRTDARLAFGEDVGDNRLVVVDNGLIAGNDGLTIGDDGLFVDNDELVAGISKKIDVDDGSDTWVGNQADARPGNELNADLIMIITGDIRANLIKDFNIGVLVVVLAELSHIVPNKHAIDSSAQIFANVINILFGNLSLLWITLPSSLLFAPLLAPTTSNSGNIPTIFIYYMLICI